MISRISILVLVVCGFSFLGEILGQVNVKIAYAATSPSFAEADAILNTYSVPGGELTQAFGNINFMHGIQLGLRYRFGNTAIEAGWESMNRERKSLHFLAGSDSFDERVYRYGINGLSLGLDNYFGRWGIGSSISSQAFKVDREIGNNSLAVMSDRKYQLRLHLIWQVQESDHVGLYLKPFYQFGLGNYDLTALANDLDDNDFDTSMRPNVFGISIVFYNGKQ